jgi:hypothetical protein
MNDITFFLFALIILFILPLCLLFYFRTVGKKIEQQEIFITCIYCKGTGEREEDTNAIMRDAKMALWLNHHLMSEKCKDCDSTQNKYCIKVDNQYAIFMEEYKKEGSKIQKTSCGECIGMGQFSSFDIKEQRYITQEEYEQREHNKVNN